MKHFILFVLPYTVLTHDLEPTNRYTELLNPDYSSNYDNEYKRISEFLHIINDANRIIFDTCESIEEELGLFDKSNKPSCRYNMSFINNSEVQVSMIGENTRNFIQKEKRKLCKKEKIECGELTIILKLIDIINSATKLSITLNNTRDLWTNLELIDFYDLNTVYLKSLNNYEILTNITLAKHRANIILNNEKRKLKLTNNFNSNTNLLEKYLSNPIRDFTKFIGNSIGSLLGSFVGSTINEISSKFTLPIEYKVLFIILILAIIYSKLR